MWSPFLSSHKVLLDWYLSGGLSHFFCLLKQTTADSVA